MACEGLLYNVTYPDQDAQNTSDSESEYSLPFDEEEKPIVILFGWAGAEDRYLSVYSDIYRKKGLITFRCIVRLKTMFLRKSHMPVIGQHLVRLLSDLKLDNRPIIIHCFSNGGSFIYQHFSEALKPSLKSFRIKGVIFDSAPAYRRISSYFNAIRPIVGLNVILNIIISTCLLLLIMMFWIGESFIRNALRIQMVQFKPLENLIDEENKCPQHFIYSRSDKVVPYQDVEFFANHRKSLGVDVSMECYENTQHVKHYPPNKTSYKQSVFSFMRKCLDLSEV